MQQIKQKAGRVDILLEWKRVGQDYTLTLTGGREHIGATAVGIFDERSGRATSSVITLPGHREENIALEGARRISQATRASVTLVVGIHLDDITGDEISDIVVACKQIIEKFIDSLERA